jgi:hypothetical protein
MYAPSAFLRTRLCACAQSRDRKIADHERRPVLDGEAEVAPSIHRQASHQFRRPGTGVPRSCERGSARRPALARRAAIARSRTTNVGWSPMTRWTSPQQPSNHRQSSHQSRRPRTRVPRSCGRGSARRPAIADDRRLPVARRWGNSTLSVNGRSTAASHGWAMLSAERPDIGSGRLLHRTALHTGARVTPHDGIPLSPRWPDRVALNRRRRDGRHPHHGVHVLRAPTASSSSSPTSETHQST